MSGRRGYSITTLCLDPLMTKGLQSTIAGESLLAGNECNGGGAVRVYAWILLLRQTSFVLFPDMYSPPFRYFIL